MKKTFKAFVALIVLCTASLAVARQPGDYVGGEVLVKFRAGTSNTTIANAHRQLGATVIEVLPHINVQHLQLPSGVSVDDAVNYYKGFASVAYAEPNHVKHLTFTPNDPQFSSMWGMAKIHMPEAWDLGRGAATVVTAVIDTGVDLQHEDLKNKLVPGYDFSDNDPDPTYSDAHGVHTAGTVGAETNNGKGVVGVSFAAKVMPLKIFPNATDQTSATAIMYAADHGAKVVSMSYGAYSASQTEQDAVNYAWTHGVVLVGAAGNDNTTSPLYPGSFANVIDVASSDPSDQKSGFSNYGADHVQVAAPGENILSTFPNNTYATISGTSMACPHVAGLAALLFSYAQPGTTNGQVRSAIEQNTDPVGTWVRYGRVNAVKAMRVFNVAADVVYSAIDVEPFIGTNPTGNLASIQASDPLFYRLTSVSQSTGQVAGDVVTFAVTGDVSNLRTSKLTLEANAPAAAVNHIFLMNVVTGNWDIVRASALRPTGTNRVSIPLPRDLTSYVSGGQLQLMTRGLLPNRPLRGSAGMAPMFDYKLGFIEIRVRPSS